MNSASSGTSVQKPLCAEDICSLLEQAVVKYFPTSAPLAPVAPSGVERRAATPPAEAEPSRIRFTASSVVLVSLVFCGLYFLLPF